MFDLSTPSIEDLAKDTLETETGTNPVEEEVSILRVI